MDCRAFFRGLQRPIWTSVIPPGAGRFSWLLLRLRVMSFQEVKMDPRFPVGKFEPPTNVTPELRGTAIEEIAGAPAKSARCTGRTERRATRHALPRRRLDGSPGSAPRADSHMNAYIRLAARADRNEPTIKPYAEAEWAKLEDAAHAPVEVSLRLLESLHERWVRLLRSVKPEDFCQNFPSSGTWRDERSIGCCSCTHGTAAITPRTSPNFANKKAGRLAGEELLPRRVAP